MDIVLKATITSTTTTPTTTTTTTSTTTTNTTTASQQQQLSCLNRELSEGLRMSLTAKIVSIRLSRTRD